MNQNRTSNNIKVITNQEKVKELMKLVKEQSEFYNKNKLRKYSILGITKILKYQDRTRIRNTIKQHIGNDNYNILFRGYRGGINLESIKKRIKEVSLLKADHSKHFST